MTDDLISRQVAIDTMKNFLRNEDDWFQDAAASRLRMLPTAEPRKGKWERHYSRPNVYADLLWHCSECGYRNSEDYAPVYHHYCPNCGARMEE